MFGMLILLLACQEDEETYRARMMREYADRVSKQRIEIEKNAKSVIKKREERNAKGDTVALASQTLQDFLPKESQAYTQNGVPINAPSHMNGNAFATVEQTYTAGNKNIRLTIRDSNKGVSAHAGIGKSWLKKNPINNKKVKAGYVLLAKKFNAWEYFEKKNRRAGLSIEVSDRIFIEFIGTEQTDTEALKALAKQIDLQKLATY